LLNTDTAANGSTTEVLNSTPTQAAKELATFVSTNKSNLAAIRKQENVHNSSLKVYISTPDPSLTGFTKEPQTSVETHSPASPSESTENFDFKLNSVQPFQPIPTEDSFLQDNEKNLSSSYDTFPLYISLFIGILFLLFIILLILVLLRYKTVLKDRFVGKLNTLS
jgi:hypothetical protein